MNSLFCRKYIKSVFRPTITDSSLPSIQQQSNLSARAQPLKFASVSDCLPLSLPSPSDCWWFACSPRCRLAASPPWQRSWRRRSAATRSPSSSSVDRTSPAPSWWPPCPAETSAGSCPGCGPGATPASRRPPRRSPCVKGTSFSSVSVATSPPQVACEVD